MPVTPQKPADTAAALQALEIDACAVNWRRLPWLCCHGARLAPAGNRSHPALRDGFRTSTATATHLHIHETGHMVTRLSPPIEQGTEHPVSKTTGPSVRWSSRILRVRPSGTHTHTLSLGSKVSGGAGWSRDASRARPAGRPTL